MRALALADRHNLVAIAVGSPPGQSGSTNTLRIHRVGDLADAGQLVEGKSVPAREKVGPWRTTDQEATEAAAKANGN